MKRLLVIVIVIGLLVSGYVYMQKRQDTADTTTKQKTPADTVQDSREAVDQSQERRDRVQSLGNEALNE